MILRIPSWPAPNEFWLYQSLSIMRHYGTYGYLLPSKILLVLTGFSFLLCHLIKKEKETKIVYKKPSFIIQTPLVSFMGMVALLFFFIIILPMTQFKLTSAMAIHDSAIPNCLTKCGNVDISSPFGIGRGCFFQGFEVICNQSIPYLSSSNLQLLEILPHEVRVSSKNFIAESCFSEEKRMGQAVIQLPEESPYTISTTKNMFVIIGCYAAGEVFSNGTDTSGCYPSCPGNESMVNSSCSGIGCCQVPLPPVSKNLYIEVVELAPSITNCTYGFVVENGTYNFTESDLYGFNMNAEFSMRLGWSVEIRDMNCSAANNSLCGANTQCKDSEDEHICTCLQGYEGNPYLYGSIGCRDIDECKTSPCVLEAKCRNEVPGFRCECPIGSSGDGRKDGNGCYKKVSYFKAALGTILCIGSMLLFSILIYWARKKRELMMLRIEHFRKNGGILLKQQLSSLQGCAAAAAYLRIYSSQELRVATNNYSINNVLGSSGNSTVYKGILEDGSIVAIKKSQVVDQSHIEQFINEIVILSQINHRNVVKLLGCCLEEQVPLLVYEFISNGTLYQKIHEIDDPLMWRTRFRIAIEIADALCYLHSSTSIPIFHRDIKSSNILLDKNYAAKVADFGVSRLVPIDKTKVSTMILGTFGYLDPEYFNTGKLTEKSDVYSFGVVLLELLTRRKSVWLDSSLEYRNLPIVFPSYVQSDNLIEILDRKVVEEGKMEELQLVADVSSRCVRPKGEERPTMKEVGQELVALYNNHVGAVTRV